MPKKKPKILHLAFAGVAGSPRGTLLLAQGEKPIADPYLLFFGGSKLIDEYKAWVNREGIRYAFVPKTSRFDFRFLYLIPKIMLDEKPDVLFIHGTIKFVFALPYMMLKPKTKVIVVEHGPGLHLDRPFTSAMAKLANKMADGLVFVSQDVCDYWKRKYGRFPRSHAVIANGVDIGEFEGLKKQKFRTKIITMVAVMSSQKDHITLVRAMKELKKKVGNVRLVLVGDGPKRQEIEEEVVKLGIKDSVKFLINAPRKEVLQAFKDTDAYVLSTNGEGLSRSILEAMAAKVPVVATDVSGNSGFIKDKENGLLVPLGDERQMAVAIERLLKDKNLAKRLTKKAFDGIQAKHSIGNTIKQYLKFIKKVAS
jgi:glycosyltransferase involved in cell wall biosynthesis